jgi:hypothetical protein
MQKQFRYRSRKEFISVPGTVLEKSVMRDFGGWVKEQIHDAVKEGCPWLVKSLFRILQSRQE